MIKLFPAQLWTPDTFKALRAVGMFGEVDLLPSGIHPDLVDLPSSRKHALHCAVSARAV